MSSPTTISQSPNSSSSVLPWELFYISVQDSLYYAAIVTAVNATGSVASSMSSGVQFNNVYTGTTSVTTVASGFGALYGLAIDSSENMYLADYGGHKIWYIPSGGSPSILAGSTSSNDGDVSGNYGLSDFWIVKLSPFSVNTQTLPGQNFNLQVFPNPAQQSITLKTLFAEPDIKVIIINLSGEEITRQTITNGEPINISNFANGMYLLTAITSSGKICAGKFCKFD
jgi:hypothetical protein